MVPPNTGTAASNDESSRELGSVMNAERILGALIWSVYHHRLPDDLLELIEASSDDLSKFMARNNDEAANLIAMAQGYARTKDPGLRDQAIISMQAELEKILAAQS